MRCPDSAVWVSALCFALGVVGCDRPGPRTYPVSGTVAFDGRKVSNGDIIFVPEDPAMAPDAGKVADGRFRARAKEGPCRVEITALDIGPDTPVVMGSPVAENYIPERYNRASQLTVQVSADEDNVFDFALTSGAPTP